MPSTSRPSGGSRQRRHPPQRQSALPVEASGAWRFGQALGVWGLAILVVGLARAPTATLRVFWMGLIPLLPAVLLLHPSLWRNVCPLATLNTWSSRLGAGARSRRARSVRLWGVGLLTFGLLVAARPPLLNGSATAVGALLLAACVAAVASGLRWGWKSGFCNTLCPMLPVERLYGHAPLLDVPNGRCDRCAGCSPFGCIDLSGERAARQALVVNGTASSAWRSPFGLFVLAFPGIVVGYALADRVPTVGWGAAFGWVLAGGVLGGIALGVVVHGARLTWRGAARVSAGTSALLFYGLLAGRLADAWGLGRATATGIRVAAVALVGVWALRGWREAGLGDRPRAEQE